MAMVPLKGEIQPPARVEAMHQGETPVDVTAVVASAKAELWETCREKCLSWQRQQHREGFVIKAGDQQLQWE